MHLFDSFTNDIKVKGAHWHLHFPPYFRLLCFTQILQDHVRVLRGCYLYLIIMVLARNHRWWNYFHYSLVSPVWHCKRLSCHVWLYILKCLCLILKKGKTIGLTGVLNIERVFQYHYGLFNNLEFKWVWSSHSMFHTNHYAMWPSTIYFLQSDVLLRLSEVNHCRLWLRLLM